MTKRHIFLAQAFMLVLVFCWAAGVVAFECNGKFISEGSFRDEVLQRCGPPSSSDTWQEERPVDRQIIRDYGSRYPYPRPVMVTMERWTYNSGPNQFMKILTFQDGKLISIRSGGVGN